MMKKQSRYSHVDQVLIMNISIIVVYEQGVGLKSSITADTAFRKDLPCRGVPTVHYRRRMLAHLSQLLPITGNHCMIWSQEIRNDKPLYLTTHKSGWPPVSRHPSLEPAALSIWSLPSVAGLDSRFITHGKRGPQPDKMGQQGNYVLTGPGWLEKYWRPTSTHTVSNGKSAWATTRNV